MEKELFTLLRSGLENSTPDQENLSDLIMMSSDRWSKIGEIAQKQGVLGIMLDGIDKVESTRYGLTKELSTNDKGHTEFTDNHRKSLCGEDIA